jgi:hypothetical protein
VVFPAAVAPVLPAISSLSMLMLFLKSLLCTSIRKDMLSRIYKRYVRMTSLIKSGIAEKLLACAN